MAHIQLPEGLPGIVGPLTFSPDTAKPLLDLAELLLRGPNTLSSADREMIATYVSSRNDCCFCQLSHGAAAAERIERTATARCSASLIAIVDGVSAKRRCRASLRACRGCRRRPSS